MPEHLLKRGSVWYYQRRVPDDVRTAFGKPIVKQSLKTGQLAEAKRRRAMLDVHYDEKFDALRKNGPAQIAPDRDARNLEDVLRTYVNRKTGQIEERLRQDPPLNESERADMLQDAEIGLQIVTNLDDPRGSELTYTLQRKLLGDKPPTEFGFSEPAFETMVRRALIETQRQTIAFLRDDFSQRVSDRLFDANRPPSVTFAELSQQYLDLKEEEAQAFGLSDKNVVKQVSHVRLIRELVGDGILVRDIDYDACLNLRALLARVPRDRTKRYRDCNLQDAIDRAIGEGWPRLAFITQQQYLATFKEILALAVRKRLLPSNPADGLQPLARDVLAPEEKRRPFTADQVIQFFSSEFYRTCSHAPRPYRAADMAWRFWLPLMMTFMGLRPREICQLHVDDLKRTEAGVWFIDVKTTTDEDDDQKYRKSLKTKASRRQVPLHEELRRIGLVEFVKEPREAGDPRVFPELRQNSFGDPASYALRRLREKFLPESILMDERQAVYSFRHTWRDALRRAKVNDDAVKALGGWAEGRTTSDHYGSTLQPDLYAEAINAVAYDCLDLSHLYLKS